MLLEKQGRCSQKLRHSNASAIPTLPPSSNLAQVSHTVGQNMADISNIGGGGGGGGCGSGTGSNNGAGVAANVGTKKVRIKVLCGREANFVKNTKHFRLKQFTVMLQIPKIVTTSHAENGLLPPRLKERGASLPPSALPRPPRSLKPPRKIDYDRLSDTDIKTRSQTPPKLPPSPTTSSSSTVTTISNSSQSQPPPSPKYDQKSLKRNDYGPRDFSPTAKSYLMMPSDPSNAFPKPDFSLKRKDYGSMKCTEFSKPDYTSTKSYHRLEESPKPMRSSSTASSPQRSLLPAARKYSPAPQTNGHQQHPPGTANPATKNSRDSLNSSGSNNSSTSIQHQRFNPHHKSDSSMPPALATSSHLPPPPSYQHAHSRTPPKYQPNMATMSGAEKTLIAARHQNSQRHQLQLQQQQHHQLQQMHQHASLKPPASGGGSAPNSPTTPNAPSALPPKPLDTTKNTRRSGSLSRGENRYRIQF